MVKSEGTIWYLIADAARARLLKLESGPARSVPISGHKVVAAVNEELLGRNLKSREILTDRSKSTRPSSRSERSA